jgi:hypothetical protein
VSGRSHENQRKRDFTLQILHQFNIVLTMPSPTHLIPYPQSTTSIHPHCNLLFFLLPILQPKIAWRSIWKILSKGRTKLQLDDLHQSLSSIKNITIISFDLFLLASLPLSLPLKGKIDVTKHEQCVFWHVIKSKCVFSKIKVHKYTKLEIIDFE